MKRLYRIEEGKMLCGVCGGIAAYCNVDPTVIRLLTLAAGVCSAGTVLLLYLGAAVCMPKQSDIFPG